ncbi:MAG: IS6 family transposase [Nitrososphaerota archaeon]|jgi:transposase-like protein|nr:IS6 family transposase [Nitrososphaerota archaeon]MDG6932705.1 IS6 family transposase [Nitrososphaerota archaeon]MDG6935509.1 IS6 family transposase [Nitrososphaerota archaeon]MDG6943404.1 IS6 family transposase [Nitrososphaerota archaeon]
MALKNREQRGIELLRAGAVSEISQSEYIVKSQSADTKYSVAWKGNRWTCTCEDFVKSGKKCKHIYAVLYFKTMKGVVLEQNHPEGDAKCPSCRSADAVVKKGFRYGKGNPVQVYFCKSCGRKFSRPGVDEKAGYIVMNALDLYFRGLSLRQTAEHLESAFRVEVSPSTILRWIRKYTEIADAYMNGERGEGERWGADETVVKLNGRKVLFWTLLDEDKRFLIAVKVSQKRDAVEAAELFRDGLKTAKQPMEVVTDGTPFYPEAVSEVLGGEELVHISGPGLTSMVNNNKVERLNGTFKKRVRPMGAFRSYETASAFAKDFRLYYNYIKPHRYLKGMTPAQASGFSRRKLGWKDLLPHNY